MCYLSLIDDDDNNVTIMLTFILLIYINTIIVLEWVLPPFQYKGSKDNLNQNILTAFRVKASGHSYLI